MKKDIKKVVLCLLFVLVPAFIGFGQEMDEGEPITEVMSLLVLQLGIILFAGAVAFYLITLPVEMDASARALKILRANNVLSEEELKGVRKVLTAAAMTYVAAALTALMNLLRFILIANNRRRR